LSVCGTLSSKLYAKFCSHLKLYLHTLAYPKYQCSCGQNRNICLLWYWSPLLSQCTSELGFQRHRRNRSC